MTVGIMRACRRRKSTFYARISKVSENIALVVRCYKGRGAIDPVITHSERGFAIRDSV